MRKIVSIFTLLLTLLLILAGCDNGSVSDSSVPNKSSGLVKVCLTVDGDSSDIQKSVSATGSYWTSFTYQYNAVPQWIDPAGTRIHGATDWLPINYSAGMSIGYYSPGPWVFGIRIKNGSSVIYEGFSDVVNVENTSVNVDVLVNKLVTDAVAGSVRIAVTAPAAVDDTLSISYTGTASGGPFDVTATSASDRYPFEYTVSGLNPGTYNFTLTHSAGDIEGNIEVVMPADAMAVISGHMDNGIWQLGCITPKIYGINLTFDDEKGVVHPNATSAAAGDLVTVYVKALSGSELHDVSITWGTPAKTITPIISGDLYSFTMPDGAVNFEATFTSDQDPDINITYFKYIIDALYDAYPVTSFSRSAVEPQGVEYVGIKNVKIWYDNNGHIYWHSDKVGNTFKFKAGSMADFFREQTDYTSIDLTGIDTSAVTNMSHMFYGCIGLTSVTLDSEKVTDSGDPRFGKFLHFNTANVTDMSYMFSSTALDGSGAGTKKMNIRSLDVSGLDTSSVTNMSHMFYLCSNSNLTTLNVSGFNTSNVTDMSYMFACWRDHPSFVTAVNMSNWDFSKVTTVNRMFDRCENVVITFPTYTELKNIEDILYWFSHCFQLTGAQLQAFIAGWDFSEHKNKAALQTLFSKTASGNDESVPNNRIMGSDMNPNNKPADFGTRFTCPTYSSDDPEYVNPITVLYVGGNLGDVKYQRLTTVATP
ncbi:MAG: BspA family leucine-rich repeat surface protein [Spirochaetia bacterium]|nr:BspA family leucine-rich repeat surface protein [Spirochaetia bacterium]